jgi:hypothetical protein
MTGIIAGFGMRISARQIINVSVGYLQFLLLGRAEKECDGEIGSKGAQASTSDVLIECVYKKMRSTFN